MSNRSGNQVEAEYEDEEGTIGIKIEKDTRRPLLVLCSFPSRTV